MVLCSFSRRIFLIAEHRHRQFAGGAEHLDLGDIDFDLAGRQVDVLGAGRALAHLAVDADHPLRAQLLGLLERLGIRIAYHLGQAVMVAQIDEQYATMVPNAVARARQAHVLADIGLAQRAASM